MHELTRKFQDFFEVVVRLRKECPWDSVQTHQTLSQLMIEEVYEATDAIEKKDYQDLKKELGDILLHVVLNAIIAEETNTFTMTEVLTSITKKLIERHPHIFSDVKVNSVDEVKQNWEALKLKEGRTSVLEGVPDALPALLQAYRIQEKVASIGFDWQDRNQVWEKVEEEIREIKAVPVDDKDELEAEFGDLLFSLVNYARHSGLSPEGALSRTNRKFKRRFEHVEKRMKETGREWHETSLQQMDLFWDEAKGLGL
ncbi:MAG: nucleoside triphosphate pyrophosphohydrolase [Bacteroidetes bacterium]|nr:nucleoside triphosphate pyrophosphohydrolase [Bacteroidota bacterium]